MSHTLFPKKTGAKPKQNYLISPLKQKVLCLGQLIITNLGEYLLFLSGLYFGLFSHLKINFTSRKLNELRQKDDITQIIFHCLCNFQELEVLVPVTFQHHSAQKKASRIKLIFTPLLAVYNPVKSDIGRRKHGDNFWTAQQPYEGHSIRVQSWFSQLAIAIGNNII